jgi:hypothetical protein
VVLVGKLNISELAELRERYGAMARSSIGDGSTGGPLQLALLHSLEQHEMASNSDALEGALVLVNHILTCLVAANDTLAERLIASDATHAGFLTLALQASLASAGCVLVDALECQNLDEHFGR